MMVLIVLSHRQKTQTAAREQDDDGDMSVVSAIVDEDPEDNDVTLSMKLRLAANETGVEFDEEDDGSDSDSGDDRTSRPRATKEYQL